MKDLFAILSSLSFDFKTRRITLLRLLLDLSCFIIVAFWVAFCVANLLNFIEY